LNCTKRPSVGNRNYKNCSKLKKIENIYQDSVEDEKMGYVFLATINLKDNKIQYKGKTTRLHAGLSVVVRSLSPSLTCSRTGDNK
jgi:hypothetical protein